jgi:hypothetical protein
MIACDNLVSHAVYMWPVLAGCRLIWLWKVKRKY